jgi:hypothetical protein
VLPFLFPSGSLFSFEFPWSVKSGEFQSPPPGLLKCERNIPGILVKEARYGTGPDQHDAGETHDSQGRCQPFDHVARGPVSIFVGAIGDKQGLKPPFEMPMQAIGATQGKLRSVPTSAGSVSFRQDLDRNEVPTVIGWRGRGII